MKKYMNSLLSILLLSLTVSAEAAVYKFSPNHGKVEFTAKTAPIKINVVGTGQGVQGELTETQPGVLNGQLEFALDTLDTGLSGRDTHMREALETQKFPKAVLRLKDFTLPEKQDVTFPFKGEMELHGVKQDVTGTATVEIDKEIKQPQIKAEFPIKLSAYQIKEIKQMGMRVLDDIQIKVQLDIKKE